MDMEQAVEFILEAQAKNDAQIGKLTRSVDALRDIVKTGVRMLGNYQTKTDILIDALTQSQLRTEETMRAFMDSQAETNNLIARRLPPAA
jgi:hypothetical protein